MSRPGHPRTITVVGLGPGDAELLTQAAVEALQHGNVFLRTRIHPTVSALNAAGFWPSFDDLYETADSFEQLYTEIVEQLLAAAEQTPITYAVPGHPMIGESTVTQLLRAAPARSVHVQIVPGVSFFDAVFSTLALDPLAGNIQIVDALEIAAVHEREPFAGGELPLSAQRPAVIAQLYAQSVASAAKLALLRRYPDDHPLTLIWAAGTADERVQTVPLYTLDHQPLDHLTSAFIPAVDPLRSGRESDALQRIVARLRAPGGCPWDREQTHRSLARHVVEETYEVVEAIENGDNAELEEELGDLLLQVYLHAQLAEEAGDFTLEDVFGEITDKLVRRHPHVFGDVLANTAGEVVARWDEIKRSERDQQGKPVDDRPLGQVPLALPALVRAQTIIRRAQRAALDDTGQLSDSRSLARRLIVTDNVDQQAIGCLLSAIVVLAEDRGLDAEAALRDWSRAVETGLRQSKRTTPAIGKMVDGAKVGVRHPDQE